jgi:hypothetical protein
MNRHGNHPLNERPLYSEFITDFADLAALRLPSAHTILLIVADSAAVHTDTVSDAADHLFASGLTCVCVWGLDCERVHDIFDEVYVGDGSSEPDYTFMSTWHADQPLDEALWYFLYCAIPEESELPTTSFVAVTVGSRDLTASVEHVLADVPTFASRILADESQPTGNA